MQEQDRERLKLIEYMMWVWLCFQMIQATDKQLTQYAALLESMALSMLMPTLERALKYALVYLRQILVRVFSRLTRMTPNEKS